MLGQITNIWDDDIRVEMLPCEFNTASRSLLNGVIITHGALMNMPAGA